MTTRREKIGVIIALLGIPISLTVNSISYSQLQSSINNFKSTQIPDERLAANSSVDTHLNSQIMAQSSFHVKRIKPDC